MSEEGKFFAMAWENVRRAVCYNSVKESEREWKGEVYEQGNISSKSVRRKGGT